MVKKRSSDRKKIHNDTINVANSSNKQKKKWNNDNNFPDFSTFTVNQLKEELKNRGLQTNGKKITLLNRLMEVMTTNGDAVKRRTGSPRNEPVNYKKLKNECEFNTKLTDEAKDIVLWKKPLITLSYSLKELTIVLSTFLKRLWDHKRMVTFAILVTLMLFVSSRISGPHQELLLWMYKKNMWSLYWLGLGVLSSIGLGTGLHTFLLYLGPHIATVTLAACECGALNFPEPPYPDQIICPDAIDPAWSTSLWNIMRKVKLEAVMWGAGTALGELPPYFMARAARLSGSVEDELREFEELQRKKENPDTMTFIDKAKLFVEKLVNKVGFFGILACASIPNPLFDLAGITCGHFLIPFWTFFGATLVGKAVIKMMIQVLFVIIAFDEMLIEKALHIVSIIPIIGAYLQAPLNQFLENQKQKLHTRKGNAQQNSNILSVVFEVLVITMVTYFLISIINSMAQNYHRKLNKTKKDKGIIANNKLAQ